MKPACSWCKDYSKYFENVQLRILIQNYKKLCGLIKITGLWRTMESQGETGEYLMDIVRESEGEVMGRYSEFITSLNVMRAVSISVSPVVCLGDMSHGKADPAQV